MKLQVDILPWDSEFFGFSVGKVVNGNAIVSLQLSDVSNAIVEDRLTLLYWATSSSLCQEFAACHIVDHVLLSKSLPVTPAETQTAEQLEFETYHDTEPTEELVELAIAAGWSSRFRLDHRFTDEQFISLYLAWINRSCRREIADIVIVVKSQGAIAGFVTAKTEHSICQIGLIAVSENYQRKGVGKALMRAVEDYALAEQCHEIRVVTQSGNAAALALYQAMEFQPIATTFWYHFWRSDIVKD
jgi:dTDP-4-amino-4,6-dideoxy-D-galactose acyltransferase